MLGILVGVLLPASITDLRAVAAEVYTALARNTGIGMALGVGRVSGIIAPLVAGVLLDANWSIIGLGMVSAAVTLIGCVAVGASRLGRSGVLSWPAIGWTVRASVDQVRSQRGECSTVLRRCVVRSG
ncbi:hypothetical protein PP1_029810 [Pseudonocardia sp. P1]|nr:vannilate transporter VanK [Pseudonocardia sp. Ae707_Ps1]